MSKKTQSTLCKAIEKSSRQIWRDMGDSHNKGYSLGEESITDYFILNLTRMCPQGIYSWKYNHWEESHFTGADWEWWVGSKSGWRGLLIQAKRVSFSPKGFSEKYRSLPHTIGDSNKLQVDLLIEDARNRGMDPLYCFYNYFPNPQIKPILCSNKRPDKREWGCTVASAHVIKGHITNKKISADDVFPRSQLLSCLLCPSTPRQVVEELTSRVENQIRKMHDGMEVKPEIPTIRQSPPEYISMLMNNGRITEDAIGKFKLQYKKILVTQDMEMQAA